MILLDIGNRVLGETVRATIQQKQADPQKFQGEIRLWDFDETAYHVFVEAGNPVVFVEMTLGCYQDIKEHADEALKTVFGDIVVDSKPGIDVTLGINVEQKVDLDDLSEKVKRLKSIAMGSVFEKYLTDLRINKPDQPFRFALRPDTEVFFVPKDDRLAIIYHLDVFEKVDLAIARIFLQEFQETRRHVGAAPPVTFGQNPPLELKEFGITEPTDRLGFISFAILPEHVKAAPKVTKVANSMQTFRTFLQYHIKCSKSHFHARMRARVAQLLKVLNRAKTDWEDDSAVKRTITGKTFVRS